MYSQQTFLSNRPLPNIVLRLSFGVMAGREEGEPGTQGRVHACIIPKIKEIWILP